MTTEIKKGNRDPWFVAYGVVLILMAISWILYTIFKTPFFEVAAEATSVFAVVAIPIFIGIAKLRKKR